ncbi:hypothetical protein TVAG_484230 [Trichomonas vaginalis G3]|uniref:Uncharacterized protein n=1 Tax=Trichomonas vaginalis (strain ATCC PRA-98 / G3) TaxID=412133 RepID=A2GLX4_TRIV3|nr:hypothetical protein TVAGG3_0705630 [Trichomonas vaginalis G3]EAX81844.1 hypothetical protein TVAG_484230 [Trichomonas vaginalis G3]KAI5509551.1 hypothetical protein TVAGG3_0705630 [Trichomonas vaginalis G3]|eukprot:XP_001294774.1 hypothetical protein [Trichomonas vaginalis G3]
MSDRKSSSFRQDTNGCPTGKVLPSDRTQTDVRRLSHRRMSDVPPTESNLKPEEPKAPAPAPQFQQFQSQSKLLPIPIQIEEGLNRLRKEYATAPIERKLLLNSVKIMFRVEG